MIKCLKCNTLYSESAKICLYCKIPLEASLHFDESYFTFKIKEFSTELEAQNFKAGLLAKEIPCAFRKEDTKFSVYIPDDAKRNAFKPNQASIMETALDGDKKGRNKNKYSYYIAFIFILLIACFIFYFKQFRNNMLHESQKVDYNIVTEGGFVDPRIIDKKSINTAPKEKKKEGKQKIENPTPR